MMMRQVKETMRRGGRRSLVYPVSLSSSSRNERWFEHGNKATMFTRRGRPLAAALICCSALAGFSVSGLNGSIVNAYESFRPSSFRDRSLRRTRSESNTHRLFAAFRESVASPSKRVVENDRPSDYLVMWRGEPSEGYTDELRELEFVNAVSAVVERDAPLAFEDALTFTRTDDRPAAQCRGFDSAVQYCLFPPSSFVEERHVVHAVRRSSLVRAVYRIVATADDWGELATRAARGGVLDASMEDGGSWCVRLRDYGNDAGVYGKRMRSPMSRERGVVEAMRGLLEGYAGPVDLARPDHALYALEGLTKGGDDSKVLAIRIAEGPKLSGLNPNQRKCVTTTPLDPKTSFSMCNAARVRDDPNFFVLDPYCGSCSTLLASATMAPRCRTVGIELSESVDLEAARTDFEIRSLAEPQALLRGDSRDASVRREARRSVGGGPFDAILADPPYGVRESLGTSDAENDETNATAPMEDLVRALIQDREAGEPTLKEDGGRLVVFVPFSEGKTLESELPASDLLEKAELKMLDAKEQYLNSAISRWMVVFESCPRG